MKHHVYGPALALGMIGSLILPHATLASRNIIQARQEQVQTLTSLSPSDPDALAMLDTLGITLEPTDSLWTDEHFVALVQKYKEIRQQGLDIVGSLGDLVIQAFDLVDLGGQIDRPEFQKAFAMTPEEKAQQEELKKAIQNNLEAFRSDPESFLNEIFGNLGNDYSNIPSYNNQAPYAYGYSDPSESVDTGRVVWLYDSSYNPLTNDMTVTWEQTYGPAVTWLQTDSLNDRAFIMPSLQDEDSDYLVFTVTADNGQGSSSYDVYVYWNRPYEGDVADAYRDIFGREISDADYTYWNDLYNYEDVSIDQIREHFQIMKKYEDMPTNYYTPDCQDNEDGSELCG